MGNGDYYQGKHRFLFPIVDEMAHLARSDIEQEGKSVSCGAGCDHCCHLLIEISWEEALEMVLWLAEKPRKQQSEYIARIRSNAREARKLFGTSSAGRKFRKPLRESLEIPDEFYDRYFYDKKRPCPMLVERNCSAYEVRPTACRLHMVTSNPESCAREAPVDDKDYEIPDRVDQLKQEAAPVITALEKDGRWGHFGIVFEAAIEEMAKLGLLKLKKSVDRSESLLKTKKLQDLYLS